MKKCFYYKGEETNYLVSDKGNVFNKITGKKLKPEKTRNGYLRVNLHIYEDGERIQKKFSVHRMVALLFVENDSPNTKIQVDHLDGDKHNNHADNLEWVTPHENVCRAHRSKQIVKPGEDAPNVKCTEEQIREVCRLLEENNLRYKEIAKIANVPYSVVEAIKYDKTWRHIRKEYKIPKAAKAKKYEKYYSMIEKYLLDGGGCDMLVKHYKPDDISKQKFQALVYRIRDKILHDFKTGKRSTTIPESLQIGFLEE